MAKLTTGPGKLPDVIPWEQRPHLRMAVAVDVTGLSRTTIYKLASKGRLTLKVLNGCVVVDTASVRKLVESAEPWSRTSRGDIIQTAARAKRSSAARAALR